MKLVKILIPIYVFIVSAIGLYGQSTVYTLHNNLSNSDQPSKTIFTKNNYDSTAVKSSSDKKPGGSAHENNNDITGRDFSFETGETFNSENQRLIYYRVPFMNEILQKRITINIENSHLVDILNKLSDLTTANFVYDDQLVNIDNLSLKATNETFENVLKNLLGKHDIGYTIINGTNIVLAHNSTLQKRTGGILGKITDQEGRPLIGANVIILENRIGAASGSKGEYVIDKLKPGAYKVKASFIGYNSRTEEVVIIAGKKTEVNFVLKSESFTIGDIKVVSQNEFIPIDPETKTKVSSGEIQHIQASSLNDVMELTPGVKTSNPTLNNAEYATIRGGDALGTQIVLDGVPVSNNVNLQEGIGIINSNSGVDLRSIPAENIKEVEVIRGIPSAQFGDLIDGLLLVKTRATAHPLRAKLKYNPNVYETNLSNGIKLGNWVFNGNLNIASSDRDFRIEGDGYTRVAAQLTSETESESFHFKNILYFTRTFDEKKELESDAARNAWYNRDLNLKYTGNYSYLFSDLSRFETKLSVSYTRRNSYDQKLISRDNIVISDRITEGTQQGRIVFGTYLGKKRIKGDEWNIYADLNYKFRFFTDEFLHSWIAGVTYRNDFNKGEGIIFDPLFPPSLSIPSPRVRTFSEIPHYNILSIYLEDRIAGRLFRPFTLQIGARYEIYRPTGFNIKGLWGKGDLIESSNGSFLNPRLNFSYNLFENTQIRLSYGVTTKSPPLGMIFAQDHYFDIVDTNAVVDPLQPDKNFSLVSTYVKREANPELKAYKQRKYEVSVDQQIGSFGFTLTGFLNNSENMFRRVSEPTKFFRYSYPDWPDQSTAVPKDTLIDTYSRYANYGRQKSKGIEFSFSTRRIPVINTVFKFDAAYLISENGTTEDYYTFGGERLFDELGVNVIPMFNDYNESSAEDLLLNYRFEIQTKSLGMWITVHIQQQLLEINRRETYDDVLPTGYFTPSGVLVRIPENERDSPRYSQLRRTVEPFELLDEDRPNKWLFNVKVSKSLWSGAAISFFVNNFFNNRPLYKYSRRSPTSPSYQRRNPAIFYGLEFHTLLSGQ